MAMYKSYRVSTKALLDQARVMLDMLGATGARDGLDAIKKQGLNPDNFKTDLAQAIEDGVAAESLQERLKAHYIEEASEDRAHVERGYRWVLRAQAKGRHAMTVLDDPPDLPTRLRFGKLRSARARGVVYTMRIILPELEELTTILAPFGVDPAFINEGKQILTDLRADQAETEAVATERKNTTRDVRAAEQRLSNLLRQLEAADQAAALERPEAARWFNLDIIHAERARIDAARAARMAARSATSVTPIESDDE